jgi:hypothetical protein
MENFIGKDGFIWWMGVVESVDDPLNLARVQVRIFGWHTDNLQQLPKSDLPWALPSLSTNVSMTSAVPVVGDYAFGFFTDSMSGQAPIIIGVFPGIPVNGANKSKGFSEGTHYPVGEPTTSRLYRNEKIETTSIGKHNNNLDTNVTVADGTKWSEPASKYATVPPYNRVTETLSGHVFEMDDTPGAERIHLSHRANTFFEIAPDGSKVTKVSGKNYEIFLSDNNVHIKGTCNITIDGNANLNVGGNVTGIANSWTFNGPLQWNGNINVNGGITATGDVIGGGISLDHHTHPDPQGGNTGPPQ